VSPQRVSSLPITTRLSPALLDEQRTSAPSRLHVTPSLASTSPVGAKITVSPAAGSCRHSSVTTSPATESRVGTPATTRA
jgi:hypothetical protein